MQLATIAIRPPEKPVWKGTRPHLRDLGPAELQAWLQREGSGPGFRATQLFSWLHEKRVSDPGQMTDLPRAMRQHIAEAADLERLRLSSIHHAADGTRKLRLGTPDDTAIESVLIPNEGRGHTLCISSMVGCSLTCRFCATASLGFVRSLGTWEILDQVYWAQDILAGDAERTGIPARLGNLVFMGMGEPLHNYNNVSRALTILLDERGANLAGRRITVSTAGFLPGIERFASEGLGDQVGLAISLNATTDEVRSRIMPINTRWNIGQLLEAVRRMPHPRRRLVTFEYVMLAGVNDCQDDPRRLAKLLRGIPAKVNLIPFNPHPHSPFDRPSPAAQERFLQRCRDLGIAAYLRRPRGDDVSAACGQLALQGGA